MNINFLHEISAILARSTYGAYAKRSEKIALIHFVLRCIRERIANEVTRVKIEIRMYVNDYEFI